MIGRHNSRRLVGSGPGRRQRMGWCLLGSLVLAVSAPATGQVLDAAWDGRQQAATFFQASLDKERRPADWAGAIRELEKCIELSPEPSWEASIQDGSGRWRRHYLPYYYLGRAWWGQGDCARVVEWLSTALAKGEVCKSKQGDTRELEKLLVKCEQRGVAPPQSAREFVKSECSKVEVARLDEGLLAALEWSVTGFGWTPWVDWVGAD